VMGYGLDSPGSIPVRGKISLFFTASRLALWPTQPPLQWVPGVKQLGCEADHLPPFSAEVKNDGSMSPLPHVSMS
jgi:hypothetical protein